MKWWWWGGATPAVCGCIIDCGSRGLLWVIARRAEFAVRSLSSKVHVTPVQFTRPFAYSSSTWVSPDHPSRDAAQRDRPQQPGGGGGCDKDVTRFVPADTAATAGANWTSTPVYTQLS